MSYFLFLDESGHDHRTTPYEVRGGLALHANRLWPFIRDMKNLEEQSFGNNLVEYRSEIKGHKLLDKDRFRWAQQGPWLDDVARRKHTLGFLEKGRKRDGAKPTRLEFTAFGQACLHFARGLFPLIKSHDGVLFAAVIPHGARRPSEAAVDEYLRKDQVFLLERYFYFLEMKRQQGVLVMDETSKHEDRKFIERAERYFQKTAKGRLRSTWIVPVPFFVSSDMLYPIQAADVCIYCINWGYRVITGMDGQVRAEIRDEFSPWLQRLQFSGECSDGSKAFHSYGIVYVPDPYDHR